MHYPDADTYDHIFENPEKYFVDSTILDGGRPQRKKSGYGFVVWQGGLARAYACTDKDGRQFIVRCWHKNPGDLTEAYFSEVSNYLVKSNLAFAANQPVHTQDLLQSYFVGFTFIKVGIKYNGEKYPVMRMDWVQGETLDEFIDNNYHNPAVITSLSQKFLEMAKHLNSKKVSHGDLQVGNLIVTMGIAGPQILLVDYDSLYVPTLSNFPSKIDGLGGFQHPEVIGNGATIEPTKVDYFPQLIIFLSLLAIADNQSLWIKGTEKQLLFTHEDLVSPKGSAIFRKLKQASSADVRTLTSVLEGFCYERDLSKLLPLEEVVSKHTDAKWEAFKQQLAVGKTKQSAAKDQANSMPSQSGSVFEGYFKPPAQAKPKTPAKSKASAKPKSSANSRKTHCPKCAHKFDKIDFYVICPNCEKAVYGLVACLICKDKRKIPKNSPHCPHCGGKPKW